MERALAAMAADVKAGGLGEDGDRLFHEAVTRAAGSPLLADFMAALAVPISETRRARWASPADLPSRCGHTGASWRRSAAGTARAHGGRCAAT